MKRHYAVLVLGLGEAPVWYALLVRHWQKRYGVTPVIRVVGWHAKAEPFEPKLARLITQVEQLARGGNQVTLIGISAGASASLNAQAILKGKGISVPIYTICGRFTMDRHWWYPLSWGVHRMPAFAESVVMAMQTTKQLQAGDYANIRCAQAVFDEVVPAAASVLPQAERSVIPVPSHHLAIYFRVFFADTMFRPKDRA